MLLQDGAIFALAAWFFGPTPVLYVLLVACISSRVVNLVQDGPCYGRSAVIVTARTEAIESALLHGLGRGITVMHGRGGRSEEERAVLLSVVTRPGRSS